MKAHIANSVLIGLVFVLNAPAVHAVDSCQAIFAKSVLKASGRYAKIADSANPLLDITLTGIPESTAFVRRGVFVRGNFKPEFEKVVVDKDHGDISVYRPGGKPVVYDGIEYVEFPNSTAMSTRDPRTGGTREFILTRGVRKYKAGIRIDRKGENSPSGYVSDVLVFEKVGEQIVYRHRVLDSAPEVKFLFEDPRISVLFDSKGQPHYYLSGTDYSPHVAGSENPDVMNRYVELKLDSQGLPLKVVVDSVSKKPSFQNLSPEPRATENGIVFVDAKNATIAQNDLGQIVVRARLRPDFNHEFIKKLADGQKWNYAEQVFTFKNFEEFKKYNWNDALVDLFGKTKSEKLYSRVRPVSSKTIIKDTDLREHLNKFDGDAKLATYKNKGLGPGTRPIRVTRKGNELFISEDARAEQISAGRLGFDALQALKIKDGETLYLTFDHEIRYFEQNVDGKPMLRRHYSASIKVFDKTLKNMVGYLPDVIQAIRPEERGLNSGILDLQHVYPMGYVIDKSSGRGVVRVYSGASDAHTTAYDFNIAKLLSEKRAGNLWLKRSQQSNDVWARVKEEIRPTEDPVNFHNKSDYLRESKIAQSTGLMQSRFDHSLETRFYFAGTAVPNAHTGVQPLVDPNSKAVFLMVHGSGTMKSSGRNFSSVMNTLGQMGYSAVAFDLPFHMEGPKSQSMYDIKKYNDWMEKAVEKVRSESNGKPVYLVGHSFGPDVIMEYLIQNPHKVQGAALLSPAGFDKVLSDWYDNYTAKMKFGGDTAENTLGGQWSHAISQKFQWNKTNGAKDPTVANPNLKLRVLTGNREEYVPAPLAGNGLPNGKNTYDMREAFRKHARNAEVVIEDGVGHYIFAHKDSDGRNVVLRELLALEGVDSKNEPAITREYARNKSLTPDETLSLLYSTDRLFKSYVDQSFGERTFRTAVIQKNDRLLKKIDLQYKEAKSALEESILEDILKLAERDSFFYERHRMILDQMRSGKLRGDTSLFPAYSDYLASTKRQ